MRLPVLDSKRHTAAVRQHWACFWLVEWNTVRNVPLVALLLSFAILNSSEAQGPQLPCASSTACADLAVEAIQRQEYEHAHDLAWRAVQTGPRNDPTLMYLLARTQSLSGRPGDALVMLQRLTAMGFRGEDVETSDDFRRVRSLPQWAQLLETSPPTSIAPRTSTPAAGAARVPAGTPGKPSTSLRIPASVLAPIELAYDAVSARFLVADADSNTLKVVDELAGNAVDLVARDWAAPYHSTAIAIDTRRGDLWAAAVDATANGGSQSRLYKLQLVSGRLLNTVNLPKSAGPTRITDVAVAANALFLLDGLGGRIFSLGAESSTPRLHMKLVGVTSVDSLALAGNEVLYIAHAKGIVRADLNTRTALPLIAVNNADLAGLQSIAWHDGALFGIQASDGGQVAVRIELDRTGKIATAREVLGPATTRAAVMSAGAFYYLSRDGSDGSVIVRKAPTKK